MTRNSVLAATLLCSCIPVDDAIDPQDDELGVSEQDLNGDTWATQDDNGYSGGTGAITNGVAISPTTHRVIVAGARGETTGKSTWLLRESASGSSVFTQNSTFTLPSGGSAIARNIYADGAGYFYALGTAVDSSGISHWIVRRSVDDGASWATVYDHGGLGVNDVPTGITADKAGNVFISGQIHGVGGQSFGKIFRGPNHGDPGGWLEVFSNDGDDKENSFAGMCQAKFGASTATFAVGWEAYTGGGTGASVYHSLDGGDTWIFDFRSGAGYIENHAFACAPSSNNILIPTSSFSTTLSEWAVASYTMSPLTWIDGQNIGSSSFTTKNAANAAVQVSNGLLKRDYYAGTIAGGATTARTWHVRYAASNTSYATFYASDDYRYPGTSNTTAYASNMAYDATRGLYVVGSAYDAASRLHGIVRHRN